MAGDAYEGQDAEISMGALAEPGTVHLLITAIDGELQDVWGNVEQADPLPQENSPKGSWYYQSGCTYVRLVQQWKKVCGGMMILKIRTSDGELVDVLGHVLDTVGPSGGLKDSWYADDPTLKAITCVYVNHAGVWKKVCS